MYKKYLILMLSLGIVLAMSGCVSNSGNLKTFSDDSISFSYPNEFGPTEFKLSPSFYSHYYNEIICLGSNSSSYREIDINVVAYHSIKSITPNSVNPNNVSIEKTVKETNNDTSIVFKFADRNGTIYGISIYDNYIDNDTPKTKIEAIADIVFNSIKLA